MTMIMNCVILFDVLKTIPLSGYAYYLINPWRFRHDQVIRRILEAGFIEKWKERVWYRMREEYQEDIKNGVEERIDFNIKPLISAITMDDFQV